MDWSSKQGRILTSEGQINEVYTEYTDDELPHHHLIRGNSIAVIRQWCQPDSARSNPLVAGAWTRPLFVGGWEHTDNVNSERVFNLQTATIFIDIRIPIIPDNVFAKHSSLASMSLDELRLYARRHAFAGVSLIAGEPPVATRHHAIDWNFVGKPRERPNKWRIEMHQSGDVWKEWGIAKDKHGQHIYMERWERLEGGGPEIQVALRRCCGSQNESAGTSSRDGFLVVCGDHFNYIRNRPTPYPYDKRYTKEANLTGLIDRLVKGGDGNRYEIEAYLSLEACHGRIHSGRWIIDASLQPWREGTILPTHDVTVVEYGSAIMWCGERWEVLQCSLEPNALAQLFAAPVAAKL